MFAAGGKFDTKHLIKHLVKGRGRVEVMAGQPTFIKLRVSFLLQGPVFRRQIGRKHQTKRHGTTPHVGEFIWVVVGRSFHFGRHVTDGTQSSGTHRSGHGFFSSGLSGHAWFHQTKIRQFDVPVAIDQLAQHHNDQNITVQENRRTGTNNIQ